MVRNSQGCRARGSRSQAGFSLIELMVVVAVIGILASIALPSYNEHIRKARRAAGGACVAAVAQQMERYYTTQLKYDGGPPATTMDNICDPESLDYYTIGMAATPRTYSITATPKGKQEGDSCGTLSINQAGVKSPSGASCW